LCIKHLYLKLSTNIILILYLYIKDILLFTNPIIF
jgi:hypothetical protein